MKRGRFKLPIIVAVILALVLVFSLGGVVAAAPPADNPDKSARPENLEQVIFVHPAAPDKPDNPGKGKKPPKDEEPKDNTKYELWGGSLAGTVEYYINPNVNLANGGDPISAVIASAEAWDAVTVTTDFDETGGLFNYAGTTPLSWYEEDEKNTISWVKFFPRDYIAVAVMWYDPVDMIIYEVDIVFNAFHKWGIDPVAGDKDTIKAYDIQNIATHEFGHPVGLDDLYDEIYSELTMYGHGKKGETIKRSLEEGDIAGAQELYRVP